MRDGRDYEELLEDSRVREVLALALRDPDNTDHPWASPMEIRSLLSNVEVGALWLAYEDHQNSAGPILTKLTDAEYNAIVEQVSREVDFDPLLLFAPPLRRSFTRTMALELLSLRMRNALPTTSSDNATSETPNDLLESVMNDDALLEKLAGLLMERLKHE